MRSRPIIVEFSGLPGAGKTTVARQLIPELRARGYVCGDRDLVRGRAFGQSRVPYARMGQFYLGQRPALRSAFRLAVRAPRLNGTLLREVGKLVLWSYRLRVAQDTSNEIVVLDQGIVQQAWSMMVRGNLADQGAVRAAVSTLILGVGVPLVLIYVDVGVQLAIDRITSRPTMRSTFDRMSADAAAQRLAVHQQRLTTIFRHATADTGAPHLTLDGSRPAAESAKKVVQLIDTVTAREPGLSG